MNVLLINRDDARENPGGDTVVIEETADFLQAQGYGVEVSSSTDLDLTRFDALHLFNLTRPQAIIGIARRALATRIPYSVTPIYWDLVEGIPWQAYEPPRSWRIRFTPKSLRYGSPFSQRTDERMLQYEVLAGAHCLFPESRAEAEHLRERFGTAMSDLDVHILPHGVLWQPRPTVAPRCSLICAGAIGPRKNQLGLVHALAKDPSLDLEILGAVPPGCHRYAKKVREAAPAHIRFRDAIPHDEVSSTLAAAKALVQPSFIETPGLAAMEARSLGLPIVVSEFPPVRECFGKDPRVFYCDPTRPEQIHEACRRAVATPPDDGIRFAEARKWSILFEPMATAYRRLFESSEY